MSTSTIGNLLVQQVERAKKRTHAPIVTLSAELPGDGSYINNNFWLREINKCVGEIGISFDFTDPDNPSQMVDKTENPLRVANLERKLAEAQAYIADLEEHMEEKVAEKVEATLGKQAESLSSEETALRAVERQGFYIDNGGAKWVDIATEANRLNKSTVTVWRAVKNKTKTTSVVSWVVGTTNANGDRILVKEGSFVKGKRSKKS